MIQSETRDGVAVVTLSRVEKRNALTAPMLVQLGEAVRSIESDTRVLVLSGAGETFCAGFDLSVCRDDDAALSNMLTALYHAVDALRRAPCPVVVAAQGAAIAGGCALLGGADFVVTNAAAKIGYPVVRLGISPAVTAPFLRACIGDAAARELLLEGLLIDGRAAQRVGLASECIDSPAEVMSRAMQLATSLASKPSAGMRATRAWLGELDGTLDAEESSAGLKASLTLVGGAEQQERLAKLWAR